MLEKMQVYTGMEMMNFVEKIADLHLGLPEPEEIAYAVLFLASEESNYITGFSLCVDSGHLLYK